MSLAYLGRSEKQPDARHMSRELGRGVLTLRRDDGWIDDTTPDDIWILVPCPRAHDHSHGQHSHVQGHMTTWMASTPLSCTRPRSRVRETWRMDAEAARQKYVQAPLSGTELNSHTIASIDTSISVRVPTF